MRVFSNTLLPLFLAIIIITVAVADNDHDDVISSSASAASHTRIIDLNNNDSNELEDEVMHETIATGRGDRDEVGEREEWSKSDHLHESSRFDTRKGKPISSRIKKKLQFYRLECKGCDHNEAVAKINEFVLDAKRHAEAQRKIEAQRKTIMSVLVQVFVGAALCALAYFFYHDSISNKGSSTYNILGGSGGGPDDKRRMQIEDQRRRAAARLEEEISQQRTTNAPTWVDNEILEVWTPKQEKQFENAVAMYGRMAPKTRYNLIAENVDDKTKQECLMHHKLQQIIAKEQ